MLRHYEYVSDKLRSLHTQTYDRPLSPPPAYGRSWTLMRSAMSAGGRAMRRLGEGMERWARTEPAGTSRAAAESIRSNDLKPCTDC